MTKARGNEAISHHFTNSAFVLRPFASEAPGISFSSRIDVADTAMFVLLQPHWPRSDVIVTILSELSAIMKVVYGLPYWCVSRNTGHLKLS